MTSSSWSEVRAAKGGRLDLEAISAAIEQRRAQGRQRAGDALARRLIAELQESRRESLEPTPGLRTALKEAVRILSGGRPGYVGDHYIREVQVKQSTVDRLAAVLRATPSEPDGAQGEGHPWSCSLHDDPIACREADAENAENRAAPAPDSTDPLLPRTAAGRALAETLATVPHAKWKPQRGTFEEDIAAIEAEARGVTLTGARSSEVDGLDVERLAAAMADDGGDPALWTLLSDRMKEQWVKRARDLLARYAALAGDTGPKVEPEPQENAR